MPFIAPALAYIGTAVGASAATATAVGATVVATTATVAGTGISAYASYKAGKATESLNNYNAALADQNAQVTQRDAAIQANWQRHENERIKSKQRAAFAANGFVGDTGSPLLTQVAQAGYLEMGALETERQGNIKAGQYAQQSVLDRMAGKSARSAGNLQAGAYLLQGAGAGVKGYYGIG